jgi:hypothetical protein
LKDGKHVIGHEMITGRGAVVERVDPVTVGSIKQGVDVDSLRLQVGIETEAGDLGQFPVHSQRGWPLDARQRRAIEQRERLAEARERGVGSAGQFR